MSDEQNNVIPEPTISDKKPAKAEPKPLDITEDFFDEAKVKAAEAYAALKKANASVVAKVKKAEAEIEKYKLALEKELKAYRKSHKIDEQHISLDSFVEHLKAEGKTASTVVKKVTTKTATSVKKTGKKVAKKASKAAEKTKAVALQKAEAVVAVLKTVKGKIAGPDYKEKVRKHMKKTEKDIKGMFFRPTVDGVPHILDVTSGAVKEAGQGAAKYIDKTTCMKNARAIIAHYKNK